MKQKVLAYFITFTLIFSMMVIVAEIPQNVKAEEPWLDGWTYRKSHVINAATGAGTGYQVKIVVYYGSGSDSGGSVYLAGSCQADFDDIRFTDNDKTTPLYYWRESKTDSDNAVFWVKVNDSLESASATIYLYYGNAGASSASSGENTAEYFTDFPGSSLPANWITSGTVSYAVSGGNLTISKSGSSTGGWVYRQSAPGFGKPMAVRMQGEVTKGVSTSYGVSYVGFTDGGDNFLAYANGGGNYIDLRGKDGSTEWTVDTTVAESTWGIWEIQWKTGHGHCMLNDVEKCSRSTNIAAVNLYVGGYCQSNAGTSTTDWIFVRKWVDPEPAHSTWGTQETVEGSTAGFVLPNGYHLAIDGVNVTDSFVGLDETTALAFAFLAYCEGQTGYWGDNMNFPEPEGTLNVDNLEDLWDQYFWYCNYYDINLMRFSSGDDWATEIGYEAYTNHEELYYDVLDTLIGSAYNHSVYVILNLCGSQEYPLYAFGGTGSVFTHSHSAGTAYHNWIDYLNATMVHCDASGYSSAIFSYDVWNEPDHNSVNTAYWDDDQIAFRTWARLVANDTCPLTEHIVNMGVGAQGDLFPWGENNFYNATSGVGFDICDRHYYASAEDEYLVQDPIDWATAQNKPLLWSELGKSWYDGEWHLERWPWFEAELEAYGSDAWCNMVLEGTADYPYEWTEFEITSIPLLSAFEDDAYYYDADCDVGGITWNLTGNVTTWASVNSGTGNITGTPTEAGWYNAYLTADNGTAIGWQNFTLRVYDIWWGASNAIKNPLGEYGVAVYADGYIFIGYMGDCNGVSPQHDWIVMYDGENWSDPVMVDDTITDDHAGPTLIVDDLGYIHYFYGCHETAMEYKRSTNPYDITSWTTMPDVGAAATYPFPFFDYSTNTMYLMYRKTIVSGNDYDYVYKTSTDRGNTWSSETIFLDWGSGYAPYINLGSYPGLHSGHYVIPIVWDVCNYSTYPGVLREDAFYAYMDLSDKHLYSVTGVDLGTSISKAESYASCLVFDSGSDSLTGMACYLNYTSFIPEIGIVIENGSVYDYRYITYDAGWTTPQVITHTHHYQGKMAIQVVEGSIQVFVQVSAGTVRGGQVEYWRLVGGSWEGQGIIAAKYQATASGAYFADPVKIAGLDNDWIILAESKEGDFSTELHVAAWNSTFGFLLNGTHVGPLPPWNGSAHFTSSPITLIASGDAYTYDANCNMTVTFVLYTDAAFLSISNATGLFSGTTDSGDVGTYWVHIKATNAGNKSCWQNYSLEIRAPGAWELPMYDMTWVIFMLAVIMMVVGLVARSITRWWD